MKEASQLLLVKELIMKTLNMFLESSTIHGLNHISNSRKCGKLFWIWIVVSGFLMAVVLIYQSFLNWRESPFTTTVKTLPITLIKFPKVTVCPPKESLFSWLTNTVINLSILYINPTFGLMGKSCLEISKMDMVNLVEFAIFLLLTLFLSVVLKITQDNNHLFW